MDRKRYEDNQLQYVIHKNRKNWGVGIKFFENDFTIAVCFDFAGRKNFSSENYFYTITEYEAFVRRSEKYFKDISSYFKLNTINSVALSSQKKELFGNQDNQFDIIMHQSSTILESTDLEKNFYTLLKIIENDCPIDVLRKFIPDFKDKDYDIKNEFYKLHKCLDAKLILHEILIEKNDNINESLISDLNNSIIVIKHKLENIINNINSHVKSKNKKQNQNLIIGLLIIIIIFGLLIFLKK